MEKRERDNETRGEEMRIRREEGRKEEEKIKERRFFHLCVQSFCNCIRISMVL